MDLNELLDVILMSGSKVSREAGKKLYKNKSVSDIKGKRIDNLYHIYGKVKDEKIDKLYNVHIKVDLKYKRVEGCTCSCTDYLSNKEIHPGFKCKHIMAVAYMFYILAKGKEKKQNKENKENKPKNTNLEKVELAIEPRLKHISDRGQDKYIAEFWVGESSMALIKSINEFIYSLENKRFLNLNDNFTYNPHKHILNEEAARIIKYLNSRIEIKGSTEKKIVGRNIEITGDELKEFLRLLDDNKTIMINYNYINYKTELIKGKLPIHFNVKLTEGKINVTSTNKMPVPLTKKLEAFLFDRKIYLPAAEQIKYLLAIYQPLLDKGQVVLSNTKDNLLKIINILSKITEDISLGEGIKRLVTEFIKPEFYFNKTDQDIYCKVKINYGIGTITLLKDINQLNFLRDARYEEKLVMEMERLKFIRSDGQFKFIGEDQDVYELLSTNLKELLNNGGVYLSKSFKEMNLINGDDLELEFFDEAGDFDFKMKDFTIKELNSALFAMKNNKGFYKTKKNNYLDLNDKRVIKILNVLDSLEINEKQEQKSLDKNQLLYLRESLKNNGRAFDKGKDTVKEIVKAVDERKTVEVPRELNATLRNYQIEGFNWLNEISALKVGGILADEMGLGKTIQVIAFLLSQKGSSAIIVTPTSLVYNWRDEFKKFAPTLKVAVIHGDKKRREALLQEQYDVILTTYGLIKNDYDKYKEKEFTYCVIDEAQNIKNSKAQNTKYIKGLKAECKIALTGTPMENNLMELWSIFDYIMPGYLLSEEKFKEKFSQQDNIEELKSLIQPFILRRLKKDVILELPDKIEKKFMVEMSKEQKAIYNSYIKEVRAELKKGEENRITVFSYLTKLRQLCLDPKLIIEDYIGESAKINAALEIVDEAIKEERKILLFSQFTSVLKELGEELEKKKVKYLYLDGATNPKQRIELVNEFNSSKDIKIFLISLKAGGTGLNLTSSDLVVHFDPWWNPAIEDQATDRAHRIGQKSVVEVIKLIAKDSVEEKIIQLQEDKRELINKVISGETIDSNILGKMTKEEIISIFQ